MGGQVARLLLVPLLPLLLLAAAEQSWTARHRHPLHCPLQRLPPGSRVVLFNDHPWTKEHQGGFLLQLALATERTEGCTPVWRAGAVPATLKLHHLACCTTLHYVLFCMHSTALPPSPRTPSSPADKEMAEHGICNLVSRALSTAANGCSVCEWLIACACG